MKSKRIILAIGAAVLAGVPSMGSAIVLPLNFDPVVTQVGDGSNVLSSAGATTDIQVYDNSASNQAAPLAQQAYANGQLVNVGSSFSEGELANNPGVADAATSGNTYNGTAYVFSGGYASSDGTAAVAGTTANANRVVGDMTVTAASVSNPAIIATQTQPNAYAASGNIRAGEGDDTATNAWAAGTSTLGGTAGYKYFNNNTVLQNGSGPTNTRTVQIRNGMLYGSSDTTGFVGISLIGTGATPTTANQTVTNLFQTSTSSQIASPEAFSLIRDPNFGVPTYGSTVVPYNVCYVADNNAGNGNSQPGIQKWVWSSSTGTNNGWSLEYVITDTPSTPLSEGYNGLAAELVQVTGASVTVGGGPQYDVVLFSTNSINVAGGGNSLERFVDPLEAISPTATDASLDVLASAPLDDAFRGVALAPIPEPASASILAIGGIGLLIRRRRIAARK